MSEHILARHDMHRRTYWPSIWAIPGPDIVKPEAAVSTAPAAFAKAVGLVVFSAKFDAETEDCFTLFAEIKGEEL